MTFDRRMARILARNMEKAAQLADVTCPHCGAIHTAASAVVEGRAVPGAGDIAVCIECGEPATITAEGTLVPVDVATLDENLRDQLTRAQALWRLHKARSPS
jgi:transcription elongation factor Elf1